MKDKLYPFQISTSFDFKSLHLEICNKTEEDWNDVVISLQDGYAQNLVYGKSGIRSNSNAVFMIQGGLAFYHIENGVRLKLYQSGKLIYERIFNHNRKRAFVLYSNKAFEELTRCAIEGIRNFSETEIYYYSIGFDSEIRMDGVNCRRMDINGVDENFKDSQYMQLIKPEVFLQAIDDGIEDGVFLDCDVQVRHNINDVFDRFSHVSPDTPILNRNYWQYLFIGNTYIPQDELSKAMEYASEKQFQGHGTTNIFIFKKEMRPLFEKWKYWCRNPEITNVLRRKLYVHDEVIFNVLCWKEREKQFQANLLFNVENLKDVKAFHLFRANPGEPYLDFNSLGCGHFSQSFAPYETEDIVGFHCVKDPKTARSINDFLKKIAP